MKIIKITAGDFIFKARLEEDKAPNTCKTFYNLLPYRNKIIHVRWSGEAVWIPMKDFDMKIDFENHTSHPAPGELLLYAGGYSEPELLMPYGNTLFSSKVGQLAGNHFLTIIEGKEMLRQLGEKALWEGAQDIIFEEILE